jgi:competence protein ComEC
MDIRWAALTISAILFCLPAQNVHSEMSVHFIDVGQGGGVLIQKDGKNILYDCGDTFAGSAVLEYLGTMDVVTIDFMIISHAHKDHMGGCIDVMNHVAVKEVLHNGSNAKTAIWKKFLKTTKVKAKDKVTTIQQDSALAGIEGFELIVPYDSEGWKGQEADNSILLRITDDKVHLLLTGDCEAKCEREVIKTSSVQATVLNVGHHGSNASSTEEFLNKVKPKYAVVSAGANNQYGHPTKGVLGRLKKVKARVLRTDQDGSIVIHSDGQNIEIETEK